MPKPDNKKPATPPGQHVPHDGPRPDLPRWNPKNLDTAGKTPRQVLEEMRALRVIDRIERHPR